MTVSYNLDVSSVSAFSFIRLLFRWKGSIYKSVLSELIVFIIFYYVVFVIVRVALSASQIDTFGAFAHYCNETLQYIPLTFMLGFFVTAVVDRWKSIFFNMGFIENIALTVSSLVDAPRDNTEVLLLRRSIVRYLVLAQVLVFRDVSMRVRRRFPNFESIVQAGFMNEEERKMLTDVELDPVYPKYWVPINWALSIANDLYKDKYIDAAPSYGQLTTEIKTFRTHLATLCNYDWVPIPIAYPQVVFLATRVYFFICLFARQFFPSGKYKSEIDLYFPMMTVIEFIFIVGWMKVAEALLNPLGEDDDDFECNFLIDRNIATGLAIVDQTYQVKPTPRGDAFMDPNFKPIYSAESTRNDTYNALSGSVAAVVLAQKDDAVKMVQVDPRKSVGSIYDGESLSVPTTPMARLRKFSDQFRKRSSVVPVDSAPSPNHLHPDFILHAAPKSNELPRRSLPAIQLSKVNEESDKDTASMDSIDLKEFPPSKSSNEKSD